MEKPTLDRRDSKTAPFARTVSDEGPSSSQQHPATLVRSITDPHDVIYRDDDADNRSTRARRLPHKLVERRYVSQFNQRTEAHD